MISRYFVIMLAFGAAVVQASRAAYVEAVGLACLGAGLALLQLARTRPSLRSVAWLAFCGTAVAMGVVALRMR